MTRTKRHALHTVAIFSVAFILSFALSCIAGWIQSNSPVSYNVMGITLPGWFYPIMALNAVIYIVAGVKFLLTVANFALESGALRSNRAEGEPVQAEYNGSEVSQPTFTDEKVYDPALAA